MEERVLTLKMSLSKIRSWLRDEQDGPSRAKLDRERMRSIEAFRRLLDMWIQVFRVRKERLAPRMEMFDIATSGLWNCFGYVD
jgi:hypothetical protein